MAEESLSSPQLESMETSHRYESWGPLYIQETGEEEKFTPVLRKVRGRTISPAPAWCPRPLWWKKRSSAFLIVRRSPGRTRQNEFLSSFTCVSVSLGMGTNDTLLRGELKFGKGTVHGGEGRLNELIRDGAGSFVHDLVALLSSVFSVDFSFLLFCVWMVRWTFKKYDCLVKWSKKTQHLQSDFNSCFITERMTGNMY